MSKPSIIIIGPAGCGKTRHADALRRHYGLDRVIDTGAELDRRYVVPATGALVLTIEPMSAPPGVRTINFTDAAASARIRSFD